MENNENFAPAAENVVVTTEEAPKTFTQEDVDRMVKEKLDEVLPGKIARKEAKLRKEYDRKYGRLEEVLKAGTGKENVEEVTDTFEQFYAGKGIKLPQKPSYTESDIAVLAKADAEEIIKGGYEDVVEEVNRLVDIGVENMTAREKAMFKTLAEHRQKTERSRELGKIGVTEDVISSPAFKEFASKFNSNIPITEVYSLYEKTQPKKEHHTMGSMKSNVPPENGLKDFYSYEEAKKFTKADFDKDPALYKRVVESMTKWK
jgi:hypothetical protein